jgi:hypothetical protein
MPSILANGKGAQAGAYVAIRIAATHGGTPFFAVAGALSIGLLISDHLVSLGGLLSLHNTIWELLVFLDHTSHALDLGSNVRHGKKEKEKKEVKKK